MKDRIEKAKIRIAKKIHAIRKALGYATKYQREEGYIGELRTMNYIIKDLKKTTWCSTGGFSYKKTKRGVSIKPDFGFHIRLE